MKDDHSIIALAFATEEQLFNELKVRYPNHLFAGINAAEDKTGELPYATAYHGNYLMSRGLYHCIGEMLDDHSRMIHKDFYCKCQQQEDEDDEQQN